MAQRFPIRIMFGEFSATQWYGEDGVDDQAFPHFLTGARVADNLVHTRKPCGVLGNITGWDEYIDLLAAGVDFKNADELMLFEDMAGVEYIQEWLRDGQFTTIPTNALTIESNISDWFKFTSRGMFPSPNPNIGDPSGHASWHFLTPENKPYDTLMKFAFVLKDPSSIKSDDANYTPSTWSAGSSGGRYWLNITNGDIVAQTLSVGDVIEQSGNTWHVYAMDASASPDRLYYDPTEGGTQSAVYINGVGAAPKVRRYRYDQSDPIYIAAGFDSTNKRETGGNPYEHTVTITNPNAFPVQAWVYGTYYTSIERQSTNRDLYRAWAFDDDYPTCYLWIDANSSVDFTLRLSAYSNSHQLAYYNYPTMEDIQPGFLIAEAKNDLPARMAFAFHHRHDWNSTTGYPKQMVLVVNMETHKYYKGIVRSLSNTFLAGFGKRTEDSLQVVIQVLEEGAIDDIMMEFPEAAYMDYGVVRDERGTPLAATKPVDASPVTELWITDQGILRYVSEDYYVYNVDTGVRGQVTNVNRTTGVITHTGSVSSGEDYEIQSKIMLMQQNT